MIKSSLYIMFNGINSQDLNVLNVSVDSGLYEEPFLGTVNILQETIRGRTKPYYMGKQIEQKELNLTLFLPENFSDDQLREIARWLGTPDFYVPLIFSEDPDKIYFCMLNSDSSVFHAGTNNGYIKISMLCDSCYSYSPVFLSPLYDLSSNLIGGTELIIINNGDIDCHLLITVQVISGGSFSIVNKSNGGELISFTNIGDLETLTINTENESIQSDLPLTYRLDNMSSSSVFIMLKRGINRLQIYGNLKIQFKYEARFLI